MAVAKTNYLVIYESSPQVFASSSMETILKSDPPKNCEKDKRTVLFVTYFPDEGEIRTFELTEEEIEEQRLEIEAKNAERELKRQAREAAKDEASETEDPPD